LSKKDIPKKKNNSNWNTFVVDMNASGCYHAYMNTTQQLTIRGVDAQTKHRLIEHARQKGLSLNAYNLEMLRKDAGTSLNKKTNGLECFAGIADLDPKVKEALRNQREIITDKWDSYGL
jgi:beta-glucosidase/6-phospho-beta-glucosidase/beta-galactosidase